MKIIFSSIALVFLLCASVAAQESITLDRGAASGRVYGLHVESSAKLPGGASLKAAPVEVTPQLLKSSSDSFISRNKAVIGLDDPASQLKSVQQVEGAVRYEQTHLGLPVAGAEVVVHFDDGGNVASAITNVARNLPASLKRKVSPNKARKIALAASRKEIGNSPRLVASTPALQILALDIIKDRSTPDSRLVYKTRVYDSKTKGDYYSHDYYIDAKSGEVVLSISNHEGLDRKVYDCALYFGQAPGCQIDWQNSVYPPYTYMNGRSNTAPARGPNPAYNWPYFYGSLEVDTLHTLVGGIHNFVQASFGIDGANNKGGMAFGSISGYTAAQVPFLTRGFAHVDPSVTYCPNYAQFNTSNGNINLCRGMVVPDVVAHEYAHGIALHSRYTGAQPNPTPVGYTYNAQTASLVEAFADIIGESFENSSTGSNNWLMGDTSYNGTFRNLADPPSVTRYRYDDLPFPDRFYHANTYCDTSMDSGGAHMNSTIVSHAFYLLAHGGEHNGCEIVAQGIEEAKQIYFKAWRGLYLPQTATFNQAYTAFRDACNARFIASGGYNHPTCLALTKALQAVELDQAGRCSATPEAAPACAVHNEGAPNTTNATWYQNVSQYAPGEHVWVRSFNAAAGKTVSVYKVPSGAAPAAWSALTPPAIVTATADGTGRVDALVEVASTDGSYDLIIDGNNDGYYQPWADTIKTILVKTPVANDGECYRGENYSESITENCFTSSADCTCIEGSACEAINWNGTPTHMCIMHVGSQLS